jgi:hypothetical protein
VGLPPQPLVVSLSPHLEVIHRLLLIHTSCPRQVRRPVSAGGFAGVNPSEAKFRQPTSPDKIKLG